MSTTISFLPLREILQVAVAGKDIKKYVKSSSFCTEWALLDMNDVDFAARKKPEDCICLEQPCTISPAKSRNDG
jgi:hypothetical protein